MTAAQKEALSSAAVRNYMLFSFAGLLCMVPVMLMKGLDLWCVFPLILGALAVMAHWRAGPVFVLLALALVVTLRAHGFDPITFLQWCLLLGQTLEEGRRGAESAPMSSLGIVPSTPFLDLLLSLCVLVYVVGHYRLQALVHNAIPLEARLQAAANSMKSKTGSEPVNPRRAPGTATGTEILWFGTVALGSALGAAYLSGYLMDLPPRFGLPPGGWRAVVFIWISAAVWFLVWAVFGYVGCQQATRTEAVLYLQDLYWRQTRREQSRIYRWIAWARLRYQGRKEEGP